MRIPPQVKPAIGGLGVGLIGMAFPQVLSMGYGWLQLAIDGNTVQLAIGMMLLLALLKIVATSLTIGSGGSGGVFAPGLYIGGMLGGGLWGLLHSHLPWMPPVPAPFVIVGMMALFGGVAKAPIAVMLMVAEMTGQFSLLVPAMFAATAAYLVSGSTGIYESQVPTRADSPAHRGEYTIPLLQMLTVAQSMRRQVVTASPDETLAAAEQRMSEHGLRGLPVIDGARLVGMFTATDALHARQQGVATVGEAMHRDLVLAYPADNLHTALQRMTRAGVSRLPVVEREAPDRLLGILTMRDLASAFDLGLEGLLNERSAATPALSYDVLRSVPVRTAMSHQVEIVPETASIVQVANRLAAGGRFAAVVVDARGGLAGIVTVHDLREAATPDADPDRPVGSIATKHVIVARPSQSVSEALAQPGAEDLRQLPVVEEHDGRLETVGMLRRSDVVAAYLRGRDRQALIARRVRSLSAAAGDTATTELTIQASDTAAGSTLSELHLPGDSLVTAVLRNGSVLVPRGQLRLEAGDHVQILTAAAQRDEVLLRFLNGDGSPPGAS